MAVKKVIVDRANRMYQMPPAAATAITRERKRLFKGKGEIIDLAGFRWPVPIEVPSGASSEPASPELLGSLAEELAGWLGQIYGLKIRPDKEILIGGGISDMVQDLALAFIDPGDVAFVPGLGLPLYRSAVLSAGGEPIAYPISGKNEWQPRFERLSTRLGKVARILYLNSPHNPTGYSLSDQEMSELVWLAGRENILIANDAAYAGIPNDVPASLLSVRRGLKTGVEFGSFAYRLGLPGLPFGFAVGNKEIIGSLRQATALRRKYIPTWLAIMAMEALKAHPSGSLLEIRKLVSNNRDIAIKMLDSLGMEYSGHGQVPFLWAAPQKRTGSTNPAAMVARRCQALALAGNRLGEQGQGYLRISLLNRTSDYKKAAQQAAAPRLLRRKKS